MFNPFPAAGDGAFASRARPARTGPDEVGGARHCTIRYDNGNFVVIDLDSRNGTYVNQKKISKYDLIDNDTVKLGKSEFKFKSLF